MGGRGTCHKLGLHAGWTQSGALRLVVAGDVAGGELSARYSWHVESNNIWGQGVVGLQARSRSGRRTDGTALLYGGVVVEMVSYGTAAAVSLKY